VPLNSVPCMLAYLRFAPFSWVDITSAMSQLVASRFALLNVDVRSSLRRGGGSVSGAGAA
jgi:hypothetical protein